METSARPILPKLLLDFADGLARRSTCARNQVGCVVTDVSRMSIYSFGYNGNAKGFPNKCDSTEPGNCGCVHAEINALLKAPGFPVKHVFTTVAPCVMCAKAMVNANVRHVIFRRHYRTDEGVGVLLRASVKVERLDAAGSWRAISSPSSPETFSSSPV